MISIQQLRRIVQITPKRQPILLQGPHGIGKSEILKSIFEADGYTIIPLFLGQAADAGDLIGLPNRLTLRSKDGQAIVDDLGRERVVTDYAPPPWWPFEMSGKYIIFLDEVNRGKPEMMQCIMDLTLNRRLNGRALPPDTRIIGAMNPIKDGYYQVEELDPAFLDRWNVYELLPTKEEWLEWAESAGIHPLVTGFISKYKDFLDPPSAAKHSTQEVLPSRRSWERVSDILNGTPELENDQDTLFFVLEGIIGTIANSAIIKYMKERKTAVSGEDIIEKWSDKIETTIKGMSVADTGHLNNQIALYFKDNLSELKKKDNSEKLHKCISNLKKYLDTVNKEIMAEFFGRLAKESKSGQVWPRLIVGTDPTLADQLLKQMR
jgi:hypothetical protein